MKKVLFLILIGIVGWFLFSKQRWGERFLQYVRTRPEGKVWHAEMEKQSSLYSKTRSIVFLGDSHMEQCEWAELFPHYRVLNRGIPGETTGMLLGRISKILPDSSLVFLQIGINDVLSDGDENQIINNYCKILNFIEEKHCIAIPTLIFPTRFLPGKNSQIQSINEKIKVELNKRKLTCLDLANALSINGSLKSDVSWDGIHLNSVGYLLWKNEIEKSLKQFGWEGDFR